MDSDGNGIGDLQGIISKLDYIQSVGLNAIWLNPVFESGWFDGGYDVIDFYKIDPRFGTNTDMVQLIKEAHQRGIKVCLDLVAGHTSNKCKWFQQSATDDANSRYSDYYIWTDSVSDTEKKDIELRKKEGENLFGARGNFVEADAPRAKYYQKNFFECQPALNYGFAHPDATHPWEQTPDAPGPQAVKRELLNIMAFWLGKGVDGFRVDMAASLIKNDTDGLAIRKLWKDIHNWKDEKYPNSILISEWSDPLQAIPAGFNIDFMIHFGVKAYIPMFFAKGTPWGDWDSHKYCYFDKQGKGTLHPFIENYTKAYEGTKNQGYIALPSANHDFQRPNIGTRNTPDQLKVLMTFLLTMPGVPFIYYGDEIAMKYQSNLASKEGSGARSGSRTPMQWTKGKNAGFSTCTPQQLYFPVDTEGGKLTVEAQEADNTSLLHYVRKLIQLRQSADAIGNTGDWQLVSNEAQPYPMVYRRSKGGSTYYIAINPAARSVSATISLPKPCKVVPVLQTGRTNCYTIAHTLQVKMKGISAVVLNEQ
ncbi:MAG TPA: alpha-amylase family glycosyl hydrolase [Prevotella sp.]